MIDVSWLRLNWLLKMKQRFKMKLILSYILLFFLGLFSSVTEGAQKLASEPIRYLPVLDGGRIKPYDTFAKEVLQLVYGKTTYESKPAYEIVTTWWVQPDLWKDRPIFEIKHYALKEALGLAKETKYVSLNELFSNPKLPVVMDEIASRRQKKEKLDPFGQAAQRLENQIGTFRELISGRIIRVLPDLNNKGQWKSLAELSPEESTVFIEVTQAFVQTLGADANTPVSEELKNKIETFYKVLPEEAQAENAYWDSNKIRTEVFYADLHPFRWAWMSYLMALVFIILVWVWQKPGFIKGAWFLAVLGLALHIYGFGVRTYLSGRAPVTNMYESVVWVSLGTVLFSMIIEAIYRWRLVLAAGVSVGALSLILSDLAPAVLDPTIQPLEPVLRSNFWLTVHVLTITISYAAFFLAFALGDIGLFFYLKNKTKYENRIKAIVLGLYRSIQIGIGFLGPGIILGGVWADYSWGRFWGWDPKETWALIALLGYLALIHARLAGWLKDFGLLVAAILSFSLVIMAWYGVNYILGAGLHTYGFGAGGVEYVAGFIGAHILYVVFASVNYIQNKG